MDPGLVPGSLPGLFRRCTRTSSSPRRSRSPRTHCPCTRPSRSRPGRSRLRECGRRDWRRAGLSSALAFPFERCPWLPLEMRPDSPGESRMQCRDRCHPSRPGPVDVGVGLPGEVAQLGLLASNDALPLLDRVDRLPAHWGGEDGFRERNVSVRPPTSHHGLSLPFAPLLAQGPFLSLHPPQPTIFGIFSPPLLILVYSFLGLFLPFLFNLGLPSAQ